jgi:RNA polymerase sigma factor (sigma-70 family)
MGVMADAPSADDLLAHTDWLHALARALVGEAAADDVVQGTYEIALASPPRKPGPLRPWLGGVARNVARMATRGRVRRERREQQVPVTAEVPTPEQLVERVQLQQQVARIVLELPEPLRATLLLRFFEGLSAAEIARVQGIPAATVRGRIKDALDRVRGTLDAQHAGRTRWIALLAPIAVPDHAAATLAGGLIVKTGAKLVIGIVVVVLVVLGTRWLGVWGGDRTSGDAATAAQAPTSGSDRPAPGSPAVVARPGATRAVIAPVFDDDPRGTIRLEGQVIDEHEAPVGGARVAIDANPAIVVTTEADGSFVVEGLIPRDYRLEATAGEGYAGPVRLRVSERTEPVTLRLARAGVVEVVVTAAAGGKPVAGAEVELRSTLTWQATTDGKGVARLAGIGAVWAPLVVRAAGFAPGALMLSTSGDPAAPARIAVALSGGAAIAGRVVDEAGTPIGGARVVAISAAEPFPVVDVRRDGVTTRPDGSFEIPHVAAGTWRLTASHGDHAPATSAPLTVDGTSARTGVELVVAAGGIVRGEVRDAGGQPVAAAEVSVVVRGHLEWRARRSAFTAADGTFAIAGLPRRALDVVAAHDAGASAIAAVDLAARREQRVELVLDVTGRIAGTVVDRAGEPVGDAQVIAEPQWTGDVADRAAWSVRGIREAVTDQGGAFTFTGLPDGTYRLRAARPGASEAALSLSPAIIARPGSDTVRLVIPRDGRITGKVALGDGGAPLRFAIAIGGTHPRPFSTADGAFAVTAPGGTHAVVISGPGFVTRTLDDVAIAEAKDTDLGTITVTRGRSIHGRVLDEGGAPVAKARVAAGTLLTGGGAELYIADESIGARDTETDEDGRFTLDGFGPAAITVVAGKQDTGRSPSIRIPPGDDSAALELVLRRTTGLDGKVTREGAPAGDVVVIANPIGATASNFFVTTGPDGTFSLDALAPGAYVVYPMFGGGGNRPKDMYTRRVDLVAGQRTKLEIDATPGALALAVTVRAGGTPAAAQVLAIQATVSPTSLDDVAQGTGFPFGDTVVPIYLRGAPTGTIEITGMRPGTHTVCAMGLGGGDPRTGALHCRRIELDAARPRHTIDLTLPR